MPEEYQEQVMHQVTAEPHRRKEMRMRNKALKKLE